MALPSVFAKPVIGLESGDGCEVMVGGQQREIKVECDNGDQGIRNFQITSSLTESELNGSGGFGVSLVQRQTRDESRKLVPFGLVLSRSWNDRNTKPGFRQRWNRNVKLVPQTVFTHHTLSQRMPRRHERGGMIRVQQIFGHVQHSRTTSTDTTQERGRNASRKTVNFGFRECPFPVPSLFVKREHRFLGIEQGVGESRFGRTNF